MTTVEQPTQIERQAQDRRIDVLSRPKALAPGFLEDRRSVYWVDYAPPLPGEKGTTKIVASEWVSKLAEPKRFDHYHQPDRPTPIWPVTTSALKAEPSQRLLQLGQPKLVHVSHKMERSPYTEVSDGAKNATSTERLETLSRPKHREEKFGMRETEWGQYIPVPSTALRAQATGRIEQLSEAKPYHKEFRDEKPIQWPVERPALKAIASMRIQQLSRPRSRTLVRDDYDPYKISLAARRTRPTPRLDELAVPVPRKVRSKNV